METLLYEDLPPAAPLPVKEWSDAMQSAVDEICDLGLKLVEVHRAAGERAELIAKNWRLAEKQSQERDALHALFGAARLIVEQLDLTVQEPSCANMRTAAEVVDKNLPLIEQAFLTVRHSALDLLRWARRSGQLEGSTLPSEYRAGYAKFISYAPILRTRLETLQQELMQRAGEEESGPEVAEFLAAVTKYNAFAITSRNFVQAVVEPPLDLVFQETNIFLEDWENSSVQLRTRMGSEINDCCQFLLYDVPSFEKRVCLNRLELNDGIDSSLYEVADGDTRILFTVDEDPLFGQITITLLRMVGDDQYEEAKASLIKSLYRDLM